MTTLTTTLDLGQLGDCEIDVGYVYSKARSGNGMEPDEPERCGIYSVLFGGVDITHHISTGLNLELRQQCIENWNERIAMAAENRSEALRERRRKGDR